MLKSPHTTRIKDFSYNYCSTCTRHIKVKLKFLNLKMCIYFDNFLNWGPKTIFFFRVEYFLFLSHVRRKCSGTWEDPHKRVYLLNQIIFIRKKKYCIDTEVWRFFKILDHRENNFFPFSMVNISDILYIALIPYRYYCLHKGSIDHIWK